MDLNKEIKNHAKSLGFHLVSIIPASLLTKDSKYFDEWLTKGYAGDLEYMKKEPEKRTDPEKILKGARSIICLGMNYYQELPSNLGLPGNPGLSSNFGLISRYAWGKDYHRVIEKKLKKIRQFIIDKSQEKTDNKLTKQDFKLYSDAGPILERGYAAHAGLGFIGKNCTLITKEYGSWVFLAEIITTLEIPYDNLNDNLHDKLNDNPSDKPKNNSLGSCGNCTKCIDACPTKAITKPYEIDARKCISYQTIENKGKIPPEIAKKLKNRIFGCDICQEVCPHNCRAKQTDIKEFLNHIAGPSLDIQQINKMTEQEFNEKYKGSPLKRAGLARLKAIIRNFKSMV